MQAATECSLGSHFETGVTEELKWLISAAMKSGWLEQHELHTDNRRLTPAGMKRLEELETKAVNSESVGICRNAGGGVSEVGDGFNESVNENFV